ncbi:RNA polymerase sigma factor [Leptobacterium flavescens]|uniref:RNA polymerase sigma factor n=1 Tax=Leptobacterium flavescens TaxID=472055 RepID=A0A6P0UPC5_9FLAO|nr:RNA polymerase sigma factor [Leptobacterium flavescens]NER15211.1 RNA polymerase sigma factor [Leptobacterium flavescens]
MKALRINDYRTYTISDSNVVKRVISGEKELYEILLRRNNQKLFRVIRGYINDHNEIEDIMQNTYLKAYEKLHQFKHNSSFSTWLIRIGINEALAKLKSKGKYIDIYTSENELPTKNNILEMPDSEQSNPEKALMQQEAKQVLQKAIDNLSVKYRTVYILKEIEEMSISEIADCLQLSNSNVKVRLHRAKSMLKEELYELSTTRNIFEFRFGKCDRMVDFVMNNLP